MIGSFMFTYRCQLFSLLEVSCIKTGWIDRFISFYHDKLMRCYLYFYRFDPSPLFHIWQSFPYLEVISHSVS